MTVQEMAQRLASELSAVEAQAVSATTAADVDAALEAVWVARNQLGQDVALLTFKLDRLKDQLNRRKWMRFAPAPAPVTAKAG